MEEKTTNSAGAETGSDSTEYKMNRKWGVIAMLLSATGMGLVPLFSRASTRVDFLNGKAGLNAGDSVGALMATGRMTMGVIFFVILLLITHKAGVFKKLKLTPSIALGGLMIGLSLACYVTSTLLTSVANAVLFIYTGPVFCVLLARIFRKEPMTALQWICLAAVFVGMLFAEGLMGFAPSGGFMVDFSFAPSTPDFPQKGVGDIFGLLSGVFYGASMFFYGYRKDADVTARGVWNFLFAALGAGSLCLILNFMGTSGLAAPNWALNLHLTSANWMAAFAFWIVCGPLALGLLIVAGRNLPAADYSTISYWEVPVALFVGLVIFGEAFTVNTILGAILIVGGGAVPAIKNMRDSRKGKHDDIDTDLQESVENLGEAEKIAME
jgi:drug/metabolite transporter (DMT)-like permease